MYFNPCIVYIVAYIVCGQPPLSFLRKRESAYTVKDAKNGVFFVVDKFGGTNIDNLGDLW